MTAAYELHDHPILDRPVLLMALEGWIDAGLGSTTAMSTLLDGLDTTKVATFDADELLDHRARRPVMHLVEGVVTNLSWPAIELHSATDLAGNDLLLLVGAEPDHSWRAFSHAVVDLAKGFGTRLVIGFGCYPAAAPHTRPTLLSCTAATPELAERWPFLRGTLDVPAGVQAAIETRSAEAGLAAMGVWAQVPHYTSAMGYPAASMALLDGVMRMSDLSLPLGDLPDEAREARERLDQIIAGNDEHQQMVQTLEQEADASATQGETRIPSGDELAAEVERFLRDQE